jgi:hypothetical protein
MSQGGPASLGSAPRTGDSDGRLSWRPRSACSAATSRRANGQKLMLLKPCPCCIRPSALLRGASQRGLSASQPRMRADTHVGPEFNAPLQRPDTLMQLSRSSLSEIRLVKRGRAIHHGTMVYWDER